MNKTLLMYHDLRNEDMVIDQKLRQDMMFLLGQIDAICFPITCNSNQESLNQAYYDFLDSIKTQYVTILKQTIGYEE